jgi:hypothetical protein
LAISEDVSDEDDDVSPVEELHQADDLPQPSDPPEVEPLISPHALTGFSTPQTLKSIGYIKHGKVIILVDNQSTHNFIHRCISHEINCYIHTINNFEIMIVNGSSMKCGGHCENVSLQIGQYHLKSHIFSIDMGGCDIVLGVEWLRTHDPILVDLRNSPCNSNRRDNNISSKASQQAHWGSLVPTEWKSYLKNIILALFPNSIPFKSLRHPRHTLTSNLYSFATKLFLTLPMDFPLPVASMIITFL